MVRRIQEGIGLKRFIHSGIGLTPRPGKETTDAPQVACYNRRAPLGVWNKGNSPRQCQSAPVLTYAICLRSQTEIPGSAQTVDARDRGPGPHPEYGYTHCHHRLNRCGRTRFIRRLSAGALASVAGVVVPANGSKRDRRNDGS